MKKSIFIVLASMSLLSAGAYAQTDAAPATAQTTANPNGPKMTFDVMEHNFGTIKQGEVTTYEFKFKNTGKEPLVISNAVGSCGCTVPEWPKDPIAPGKTGVIKVTFNSTGKMGQIDKTVTLTSNDRDGMIVLHMKGVVEMPAATPAPAGGAATTATPAGGSATVTPASSGTTTAAPASKSKSKTAAKPKQEAAPATEKPKH